MFWKTESEFTDAFCVTSYHFMKYVHINKGSLNLFKSHFEVFVNVHLCKFLSCFFFIKLKWNCDLFVLDNDFFFAKCKLNPAQLKPIQIQYCVVNRGCFLHNGFYSFKKCWMFLRKMSVNHMSTCFHITAKHFYYKVLLHGFKHML